MEQPLKRNRSMEWCCIWAPEKWSVPFREEGTKITGILDTAESEGECLPTAGLPAVLLRKGVAEFCRKKRRHRQQVWCNCWIGKRLRHSSHCQLWQVSLGFWRFRQAHLSYLTRGPRSPSFPSRAWLSPKEKKTNYEFRGIVLFLEGTTQRLWACLMFSLIRFLLLIPLLSFFPTSPPFPFLSL